VCVCVRASFTATAGVDSKSVSVSLCVCVYVTYLVITAPPTCLVPAACSLFAVNCRRRYRVSSARNLNHPKGRG